jgi:hypothetical protein
MGVNKELKNSKELRGTAALAQEMLRIGFEDLRKTGVVIKEVRIRAPKDGSPDTMVILKAVCEGRKYVAFHSAFDPAEAFQGAMMRLNSQNLKWHEDKPYPGS